MNHKDFSTPNNAYQPLSSLTALVSQKKKIHALDNGENEHILSQYGFHTRKDVDSQPSNKLIEKMEQRIKESATHPENHYLLLSEVHDESNIAASLHCDPIIHSSFFHSTSVTQDYIRSKYKEEVLKEKNLSILPTRLQTRANEQEIAIQLYNQNILIQHPLAWGYCDFAKSYLKDNYDVFERFHFTNQSLQNTIHNMRTNFYHIYHQFYFINFSSLYSRAPFTLAGQIKESERKKKDDKKREQSKEQNEYYRTIKEETNYSENFVLYNKQSAVTDISGSLLFLMGQEKRKREGKKKRITPFMVRNLAQQLGIDNAHHFYWIAYAILLMPLPRDFQSYIMQEKITPTLLPSSSVAPPTSTTPLNASSTSSSPPSISTLHYLHLLTGLSQKEHPLLPDLQLFAADCIASDVLWDVRGVVDAMCAECQAQKALLYCINCSDLFCFSCLVSLHPHENSQGHFFLPSPGAPLLNAEERDGLRTLVPLFNVGRCNRVKFFAEKNDSVARKPPTCHCSWMEFPAAVFEETAEAVGRGNVYLSSKFDTNQNFYYNFANDVVCNDVDWVLEDLRTIVSVVLLQRVSRGFLVRTRQRRELFATIRIQAIWRMIRVRKIYGAKGATIRIALNWLYRIKTRSERRGIYQNIIKLQATVRGYLLRTKREREGEKALLIQSHWRRFHTKKNLQKRDSAARIIQRMWRGERDRDRIIREWRAVSKIQAHVRAFLSRRHVRTIQSAATAIVRHSKGYLTRKHWRARVLAAVKIQASWRRRTAIARFKEKLQAQIEERLEAQKERISLYLSHHASVVIGRVYRGFSARRRADRERILRVVSVANNHNFLRTFAATVSVCERDGEKGEKGRRHPWQQFLMDKKKHQQLDYLEDYIKKLETDISRTKMETYTDTMVTIVRTCLFYLHSVANNSARQISRNQEFLMTLQEVCNVLFYAANSGDSLSVHKRTCVSCNKKLESRRKRNVLYRLTANMSNPVLFAKSFAAISLLIKIKFYFGATTANRDVQLNDTLSYYCIPSHQILSILASIFDEWNMDKSKLTSIFDENEIIHMRVVDIANVLVSHFMEQNQPHSHKATASPLSPLSPLSANSAIVKRIEGDISSPGRKHRQCYYCILRDQEYTRLVRKTTIPKPQSRRNAPHLEESVSPLSPLSPLSPISPIHPVSRPYSPRKEKKESFLALSPKEIFDSLRSLMVSTRRHCERFPYEEEPLWFASSFPSYEKNISSTVSLMIAGEERRGEVDGRDRDGIFIVATCTLHLVVQSLLYVRKMSRAASRIQIFFRYWWWSKKRRELLAPILTLQRCARGFLTRRRVFAIDMKVRVIQRLWRLRKWQTIMDRAKKAAETIQSHWRGFLIRQWLLLDLPKNLTLIQATIRGFLVRTRLRSPRLVAQCQEKIHQIINQEKENLMQMKNQNPNQVASQFAKFNLQIVAARCHLHVRTKALRSWKAPLSQLYANKPRDYYQSLYHPAAILPDAQGGREVREKRGEEMRREIVGAQQEQRERHREMTQLLKTIPCGKSQLNRGVLAGYIATSRLYFSPGLERRFLMHLSQLRYYLEKLDRELFFNPLRASFALSMELRTLRIIEYLTYLETGPSPLILVSDHFLMVSRFEIHQRFTHFIKNFLYETHKRFDVTEFLYEHVVRAKASKYHEKCFYAARAFFADLRGEIMMRSKGSSHKILSCLSFLLHQLFAQVGDFEALRSLHLNYQANTLHWAENLMATISSQNMRRLVSYLSEKRAKRTLVSVREIDQILGANVASFYDVSKTSLVNNSTHQNLTSEVGDTTNLNHVLAFEHIFDSWRTLTAEKMQRHIAKVLRREAGERGRTEREGEEGRGEKKPLEGNLEERRGEEGDMERFQEKCEERLRTLQREMTIEEVALFAEYMLVEWLSTFTNFIKNVPIRFTIRVSDKENSSLQASKNRFENLCHSYFLSPNWQEKKGRERKSSVLNGQKKADKEAGVIDFNESEGGAGGKTLPQEDNIGEKETETPASRTAETATLTGDNKVDKITAESVLGLSSHSRPSLSLPQTASLEQVKSDRNEESSVSHNTSHSPRSLLINASQLSVSGASSTLQEAERTEKRVTLYDVRKVTLIQRSIRRYLFRKGPVKHLVNIAQLRCLLRQRSQMMLLSQARVVMEKKVKTKKEMDTPLSPKVCNANTNTQYSMGDLRTCSHVLFLLYWSSQYQENITAGMNFHSQHTKVITERLMGLLPGSRSLTRRFHDSSMALYDAKKKRQSTAKK